jgi:hypothetical protein
MDRHPQNVPQEVAGSLKIPFNDWSLQGTELMNEAGFILKCDLNWQCMGFRTARIEAT